MSAALIPATCIQRAAFWAVLLAVLMMALPLRAAEPADSVKTGEVKTESALEKQVRVVASKLRCPVCQGESVYDSHSDVAEEMKRLIADKLKAGESEADVLEYFHARYGNYILMAPPAEGIHWVIWIFPLFLGLTGLLFLLQYLAASKRAGEDENRDSSGSDGSARNDNSSEIEELRL